MSFISPMEELIQEEAREQGRQEGMVQSLLKILQIRFGELPPSVLEAVNGIEEMDILNLLFREAIAVPSVAEFQVFLTSVITSVE